MSRSSLRQSVPARLVALALPALGVALVGCPNPNIYGTARTIPQGRLQHTIAAEGVGLVGGGSTYVSPTLPTYQLRYGLSDNLDFGVRLANLTSLGADLKFNFLRGGLDLAVDPGVQGAYLSISGSTTSSGTTTTTSASESFAIFYMNLPLIVGLNLSQNFAILLTPGIGLAAATGTVSTTSTDSSTRVTTGAGTGGYGRLGIGFNIRLGNSFALHPEITGLKFFSGDGILLSFGLGFQFGAMPNTTDRQ